MPTTKWVTAGFVGALLTASLLMLNASTPQKEKEKPTCCKKTIRECSRDIKTGTPGSTNLENLSHQFISLPFYIH